MVNNLCTIGELSSALGINRKNIERYSKSLRDNDPDYFFNRPDGRGQCHKMTDDMLSVVQSGLDSGKSQYRIARKQGISLSSIAYDIGLLHFRKSHVQNYP